MTTENCENATKQVIKHLEKRPEIETKLVRGLIIVLVILSLGAAVGLGLGVHNAVYDHITEKYATNR